MDRVLRIVIVWLLILSGAFAGVARVEFLADGVLVGSDASAPYTALWSGAANGPHQLAAIAYDTAGLQVTSSPVTVNVVDAPGAPPSLDLLEPAAGASISEPTAFTGTIKSPIAGSWHIDYRAKGEVCQDWTTFGTGTGAVQNASFATLDTTRLLNGIYEIRLVVRDLLGGEYFIDSTVVVEGGMKVGQFTATFQDMQVPLAGLPLSVTRTYDSRQHCPGDFGYGWSLDVEALRLEKSHAVGDAWNMIVTPGNFTTPSTYQMADDGPHVLSVRMPDGEILRFAPKLIMDRPYNRLASLLDSDGDDVGQVYFPILYNWPVRVVYRPLAGTKGATLSARGYRAVDPWSSTSSSAAGDARFYVSYPGEGAFSLTTISNDAQDAPEVTDATGFELTTKDGRVFSFDQEGRLEQMRDRSNNTLSIVRDALGKVGKVSHSSGKEIVFSRNANGYIDTVTDPAGNSTRYVYDAGGNLVRYFDRTRDPATQTASTTFTYAAGTHYLEGMLDARGVRAAQNFYDNQGRLIRTVDAAGKEVVFTHDVAGRTETIRDRLGNVTVHRYDERGNVTRTTAPDGTVTQSAYLRYANGKLSDLKTSESISGLFSDGQSGTVQKTLTTQSFYEDEDPATPPANDGLLRKLIDPLGNVTRFAYDTHGQPVSVTDAKGNTTTMAYDEAGHMTASTDALGHVTSYGYDGAGNRTRDTNALNQSSTYAYNGLGQMTAMTDALGNATAYTYDLLGDQLTQATTRTKADGSVETLTTTHEYDAGGRLLRTTAPDGAINETIYDEIGKVASTKDALGLQTGFGYDSQGRLARTTYPDGLFETTGYDAEGRRITSTDRAGRTTTFGYDAMGRLSRTIAPDGAVTASSYDAAGRVLASTDANGQVTRYGYDDAGRRVRVIDALGHATSYSFDANGNQTAFTDALGRVTGFVYDALNRRTATLFPDNTTTGTTYDPVGRRIAETDQAGKIKGFLYDALGRLTKVIDALGQETGYTYDEVGNQLTQTDANQHTTRYEWDSVGRRLKRILPLGMTETMAYDAVGNLKGRQDFNGKITTYTYDTLNRLTKKTPDASLSESPLEFTFTATGQRATMRDPSGTTSYGYDLRNRLTSKATPFGTLTYTYDANGLLRTLKSSNTDGAEVSYGYDALNRLSTVTDRELGATGYGYDAVGNLQSFATPNGVTHGYGYNALNRLTGLTVTSAPLTAASGTIASYAYTLSPTGQRTAVTELGGRTAAYQYDGLQRLTRETITADPSGKNGVISYTLDAVGNRLTRSSTVSGLTAQAFGYDANDRLTTDTYDANGNTTVGRITLDTAGAEAALQTATDSYDSENRLVTHSGGSGPVQIVYDGDGNKVRETVNGQLLSYLVDTQNPTGYAQVVEELQNGTVIRTYTFGHDLLAQDQRDGAGTWSATWYGYDGHGSVRLLTDGAGHVTDRYDYEAFGTLLHAEGTTFNRYRYCGEQYDSALGLYYLRARFMNAASGRFWNADSYEGDNEDPVSLHKYLYCGSNPTYGSDPSGHETLGEIMLTGSIMGGVSGAVGGYIRGGAEGAVVGGLFGIGFGALFPAAVLGGSAALAGVIPGASASAISATIFLGTALLGVSMDIHTLMYAKSQREQIAAGVSMFTTLGTLGYGAYATYRMPTLPPSARVGGPAPASKGASGELFSEALALMRGEVVVARQVLVESASGIRVRFDLVTRTISGNLRFIESKFGPSARYTKNQRAAYPEIQATGQVTISDESGSSAGLTRGEALQDVDLSVDWWPSF